MPIARKFTLALIACVIAALSLNAILTVQNELGRFEQETAAYQSVVGRALRPAVINVWSVEGRDRAMALVREADQRLRRVEIRWVWLSAPPGDPFAPRIARERLAPLERGEDVSSVDPGERELLTYVPLVPPEASPSIGALEISHSLDREAEVRRGALRQALFVVVGLTLVTAIVTSVLGAWFIGRPMATFVEQARRVGRGDLSARIAISQRDEFGNLAEELNRMCASLADSKDAADRANRAKLDAIEQLRHADRLATVGRLAAGMAHELGTPLNVVSARAKPIMTGSVDENTKREYGRIIVEQVERMTKLMRQLLDFARTRPLSTTQADLTALVRRVVALVEPISSKKDVHVSVEAALGAVEARVDPAQMDQVITNLLVNAIHASREGDAISVTVTRQDATSPVDGQRKRCAIVRVTDRGEGIKEENLARVFEPFFTTKVVGEGTGLGLSVAYGIVRDHGGWINVESSPANGSSFSVNLPESTS